MTKTYPGHDSNFCGDLPCGQVRFKFHLPYSNFHLPLKNCMFYNVYLKPSGTWCWHVKAYFLELAWMPDHKTLHTFSKINQKYIQHTCPMGQARYSFHLPFSYYLQILLARGNGASTSVEPQYPFYSNFQYLLS